MAGSFPSVPLSTSDAPPPPLLQTLDLGGPVPAVCCTGGRLYCGAEADIKIWNLKTLSYEGALQYHTNTVRALASAEEHQWLFSSSADDTVIIWSTKTWTPLYVVTATSRSVGDVYSLCWVSELSTLFMGCQDASIAWLSPPLTHADRVRCGVANSTSPSSGMGTPRHTNLPHKFFSSMSAAELARSALNANHPSSSSPANLSPMSRGSSSTSLSSMDDSQHGSPPVLTVTLPEPQQASTAPSWPPTRTSSPAIPIKGAATATPAQLPSAPEILSTSPPMPVHAYPQQQFPDALQIDPLSRYGFAHTGYIHCILRAHRHGKVILASAGGDGHVCIWVLELDHKSNYRRLKLLRRLNEPDQDQAIFCLAYREGTLFGGCQGGLLKVWDLETYQCIRTIPAHCTDILTVSILGGELFSCSSDGVVKRWSSDFRQISSWQAHGAAVSTSMVRATPIPASSQKPVLLTGGRDHTLKIWNVLHGASPTAPLATDTRLEGQLFQMLADYVAFASISSDPSYREDCRRCAHFLQKLCTALGAQADLLPVADNQNPLVMATFKANKPSSTKAKRRILFYGHYDVIAPGKISEWKSPPFQLSGRDGFVYGRGVADQKGPTIAALLAVAQLHGAQELEADVCFVVEGEEESGSAGFQDAIRQHRSAIGAIDVILVSNSHWMTDDIPSVTWGLRGVVHANVTIQSPQQSNVHSGVGGGSVAEPLVDMSRLLAALTTPDRRIAIPGFYDSVRSLTREEQTCYDEVISRTSPHLKPGQDKEAELESLLARWRAPSLSLHEIKTSSRNRTIIPSSASADLSIRIVPDQSLDRVCESLQDFVKTAFANLDSGNQLTVSITQTADWWLGDRQSTFNDILFKAVGEEWKDAKPLWVREGGSIPSIPFLEQLLKAPAVHFPMSQSSDGAHLPNERVRVLNLEKGTNVLKRWFTQVGHL